LQQMPLVKKEVGTKGTTDYESLLWWEMRSNFTLFIPPSTAVGKQN